MAFFSSFVGTRWQIWQLRSNWRNGGFPFFTREKKKLVGSFEKVRENDTCEKWTLDDVLGICEWFVIGFVLGDGILCCFSWVRIVFFHCLCMRKFVNEVSFIFWCFKMYDYLFKFCNVLCHFIQVEHEKILSVYIFEKWICGPWSQIHIILRFFFTEDITSRFGYEICVHYHLWIWFHKWTTLHEKI